MTEVATGPGELIGRSKSSFTVAVILLVGGIHTLGADAHRAHHMHPRGHARHHAVVHRDRVAPRARRPFARHAARRQHARRHHRHHARRHLLHQPRHRAKLELRKDGRRLAHIARVGVTSSADPTIATPTGVGAVTAPGVGLSATPGLALSEGGLQALVPTGPIRAAHARRSATPAKAHKSTPVTTPPAATRPARPSVIQRFVRVVPSGVWLALAAALALAASAAAGAAVAGRRARRNAAQFATVSAQALTDPLTGVLNRRGFLLAAERELARSRRYKRPFALAYVDVRGLKAVNDSEGHLAGDELLRQAAGLLTESARGDDLVGRIGGDELALLLAEQSTLGATVVAGRIRDQVPARRAALRLREAWDLTIGTAAYPADGSTIEELLASADRRLYEQRGIELRGGSGASAPS
jgi:diguanylate cyclase (GGDEF)-like protein